MSYGYSQQIVEANKLASAKSLGVKLGRVCIKANKPVSEVAEFFSVSRTTVYNWFAGTCIPKDEQWLSIERFMTKFSK